MRLIRSIHGILCTAAMLASVAVAQDLTPVTNDYSFESEGFASKRDHARYEFDPAGLKSSDYETNAERIERTDPIDYMAATQTTSYISTADYGTLGGSLGNDNVVLTSCPSCNSAGASCQCSGDVPILECAPGQTTFWDGVHRELVGPCYSGPHPIASPARWYVIAEVLPLFRDQEDSNWQSLGPSGPSVLGTGSLRPEFDAGARVTLGRALGESFRIEGVYMGQYEWSDDKTIRNLDANDQAGTGNLYSPFSDFGDPAGVVGLDYNNLATIRNTSSLFGVELNLRRRVVMPTRKFHHAEASFLVGGRYMQIEEAFVYHTESTEPAAGTVNDIGSTTDNNLLGLQIGVLSQIMVRERIWVDFDVKGAIFRNDIDMSSSFLSTDGVGTVLTSFSDADSHERTAFLGDLSLTANYQFAPAMTFKIGYNLMWLTGVAVASENLSTDANILTMGPAMIDHAGDLVYHGPSAGLVWAY